MRFKVHLLKGDKMITYLIMFVFTAIFLVLAKESYVKYKKYKYCQVYHEVASDNTQSSKPLKVYKVYANVSPKKRKKYIKKFHKNYLVFFIAAILVIGLVSGLRSVNVGTDLSYTYFPNFNKILKGDLTVYTEKGFTYFNKFLQQFSSNPQILTLSTSFIFAFTLCFVSIKYSKSPILSVIVACLSTAYFISLNNVRQSIACIIMIAAYPSLYKKQLLKFLLFVLIGCIFHYSVLIFIPVYMFINWRWIKKRFLSIAIILTVSLPVLTKGLLLLISKTKYNYFLVSDFNNGNANKLNIIFGLVWFVIAFIILYKDRMKHRQSWTLLALQFFSFWTSLLSLFISVSEMISRLTNFFIFYQILIIPYLVSMQKKKSRKILIICLYLITYGLYMYYYIIMKGYHAVLPFEWCFK